MVDRACLDGPTDPHRLDQGFVEAGRQGRAGNPSLKGRHARRHAASNHAARWNEARPWRPEGRSARQQLRFGLISSGAILTRESPYFVLLIWAALRLGRLPPIFAALQLNERR